MGKIIRQLSFVLAAVFVAAQIGVATHQLSKPRPAKFGWQMYSGIREALSYELVRRDGTVEPVRRADYFGNFRIDLDDIIEPAAQLICARRPDAAAVRAKYIGGAQKELPCTR